jgi:hypothetical protein
MHTSTPLAKEHANDESASAASTVSDAEVTWFGPSRRLIGGVPDSRYGWLDTPDGPCIVKAMDLGLVAYNKTLLEHERKTLGDLKDCGAPAPALIEMGRSDWLVTRFAGLSLQRLAHPGGVQGTSPLRRFPFTEQLGAWVHLLRRLQIMADAGWLAIDLYEANVVVPLTEGTRGQLRLNEVVLIDHAHTVRAGMGMRRPAWLKCDLAYIAPELRDALQQDQERMKQALAQAGAQAPGYSRLPEDQDQHSRRVWAEYDAPQALQRLLDAGALSRDGAMQFAVATAINKLLHGVPQRMDKRQLVKVLGRMTEAIPSQRFASLTQAADALAEVMKVVPMVSEHRYSQLMPSDLSAPHGAGATEMAARIAESRVAQSGEEDGTALANSLTPIARVGETKSMRGSTWFYIAAAASAAIGFVMPLPW